MVGETPNLAARLQAIAPANAVLVCDTTRQQIGDLFRCRDLGLLEVKGLDAPVPAWHILHESPVESRFEALRGAVLTPFVARDKEVDELLGVMEARKERTRVRWCSLRAKPASASPVWSLLSATDSATRPIRGFATRVRRIYQDSALHPFIAQLEHAAGFEREDALQTKLDKLEVLLAPASPSSGRSSLSLPNSCHCRWRLRYPPLSLSPQRKKDKTFEALLRQLGSLARRHPVLLTLRRPALDGSDIPRASRSNH